MAEQRLIDANKVGNEMAIEWQKTLVKAEVADAPTIDPETLPVVRQLREELEKVTAERDALLKELAGECGLCANYENCKKYPAYCINGNMWEWCGLQKEEQHERG